MNRITVFSAKIAILSMVIFALTSSASAKPKVVIIGIDGCRADALKAARTPTVDSLLQNAAFSWDALTIPPTVSGPCWSSMLTGVWHFKHGVTDNSFANSNYENFPHFFTRIKEFDPNLVTASVVNWKPINDRIVIHADSVASAGSDEAVAHIAADYILNNNTDCLFIQFDEVDGAGHGNGYSVSSPNYMKQIERTDSYIRIVMNAISRRPGVENEDWLVIVGSDHGGLGNGHGGASLDERNIVFVVSGKNVASQEIVKSNIVLPAPATSLEFDGKTAYARVDNQAPFQFGADQDFSIECMVKTKTWTGDPAIISNKNWQSGRNPGFVLACTSEGTWKVNAGDGTNRVDINGGRINDDLWHHLVATFDRDGALTIYHDGEMMGTRPMAQIGDLNTTFELAIGQDGTLNYPHYYNGLLAEIRVWDIALSDSLATAGFAKQVDSSHPQYEHLVAYFKADDGTGKVLYDSSPSKITAEMVGENFRWVSSSDSFNISDYSTTPKIVDIPVTALVHLGVPINPEWGLDGRPVGLGVPASVPGSSGAGLSAFRIYQNYPNPFNPSTRIDFDLPSAGLVDLSVYNVLGQGVYSQKERFYPAGVNSININAELWPAGIYYYQLKFDRQSRAKKLMLLK